MLRQPVISDVAPGDAIELTRSMAVWNEATMITQCERAPAGSRCLILSVRAAGHDAFPTALAALLVAMDAHRVGWLAVLRIDFTIAAGCQ